MKTAIYARVSSESQAREGTIQSQLEALREYGKSHKLTIIEECLDDGFSGADLNRPGLDLLRDPAPAQSNRGRQSPRLPPML